MHQTKSEDRVFLTMKFGVAFIISMLMVSAAVSMADIVETVGEAYVATEVIEDLASGNVVAAAETVIEAEVADTIYNEL